MKRRRNDWGTAVDQEHRRNVNAIHEAQRSPWTLPPSMGTARAFSIRCFVGIMLTIVVAAPWGDAIGQETGDPPESFVNQQRLLDERIREELRGAPASSLRSLFDWGGWFSSYGFVFDDGVESSRTLRRYDLRLWGRLQFDEGTHEFYGRGRLSFADFNSADSYSGDDDDWEGPNLERGVYRVDLGRALGFDDQLSPTTSVAAMVGRDLVRFGNGLTLATPLDHAAWQWSGANVELTGLAGRSVGSTPDFDLSRSAQRNRRGFLGAQAKYRGWRNHEPFAYVLWQRDQNDEERYALFQKFAYDSNYFGLGSTGQLSQRLRYATEWVIESGRSYGDRRFFQDNDIQAWAFQSELEYFFANDYQGRASIEYLVGSGDGTRRISPTNSRRGNKWDYQDNSFLAFGYRDTGLALAPRYANLHMWRTGGSIFPWPTDDLLKRLEVGADCYLFQKQQADGAISDPTADRRSGYVGWELDAFANWRVGPDLSWTARYGAFFPGDAFSDQTTRTIFLLGFTWSF